MTNKDRNFFSHLIQLTKKGQIIETESDLENADRNSMAAHNRQYDKLLAVYVGKTEETFKLRVAYAKVFLWVSLAILIIVLALMCYTVYKCLKIEITVEKLSILVSVSISFLTTYIVIPKIITKYLFNDKEEEYMAKVIGNIQEFDKEIRKNLFKKKYKEKKKEDENKLITTSFQKIGDNEELK